MNSSVSTLTTFLLPLVVFATAPQSLEAADGTIYFNSVPSFTAPFVIRRVDGDGNNNQFVPINLPSAAFPDASRDGRRLLVTSPDPERPFKISPNVYAVDLATLGAVRVTSFADSVRLSDNTTLVLDLGSLGTFDVGNRSVLTSIIHFPNYKATAPDGFRVAVLDLTRVASTGRDALVPGADQIVSGGLVSHGFRFPVLSVIRGANAIPPELTLFMGDERTGFNQGGDGVDWHPAREEIVAAIRSDIPAILVQEGALGRSESNSIAEGTILAIFSSSPPGGVQPFIRRLTAPSGSYYSRVDLTTNFVVNSSQHDYAPAFSPNGQVVAYVRHTQTLDTRVQQLPLPASCAIRVVNYDGTGDREVLRLANGLWVTKLSWSPDGSEIAFDLAPQLFSEGFPLPMGDPTRSAIHAVPVVGGNPRQVVGAPASFPAWSPRESSQVATNRPPQLTGNNLALQQNGSLEWTIPAQDPDAGQSLTFSLEPGAPPGVTIEPKTGILRWNPAPGQEPGEYVIVVRATDDGNPPASATANVRVELAAAVPSVPLQLTAARMAAGKVRLRVSGGPAAGTVRIETSTDGITWQTRTDLPRAGTEALIFEEDISDAVRLRLYRARGL